MLWLSILRLLIIIFSGITFFIMTRRISRSRLRGLSAIGTGLALIVVNMLVGAVFHSPMLPQDWSPDWVEIVGMLSGYVGQSLGFLLFLVGVYRLILSLKPHLSYQYDTLVENSLVGVYLIQNGRFKYVNPRFARIFGYAPEELIGKEIGDLVAPDSRQEVSLQIMRRESGKIPFINYQFQGLRRSGEVFYVEVFGSRILLDGEPAIQGTLIDITERKQFEAQLTERERQYRRLADHNPDAIFIHSDGLLQYLNPAALELLNLSDDGAVLEQPLLSLVHPDDHELLRRKWERVRENGAEAIEDTRIRLQCPGGEIVDVEETDIPTVFEGKSSIQTIATNIGPRLAAENLLAGQKQMLEQLARGVSLEAFMTELALFVERLSRGARCGIMLVDQSGRRLKLIAAPSLPEDFRAAIDGMAIGPAAGCCGTAVFRGRHVIVEDVAVDPLWEGFRDKALRHDLRACWSAPIPAPEGRPTGTLAMYFSTPRLPNEQETRILEIAADLAGIAMERMQYEMDLLKSEVRYQRLFQSIDDIVLVAPYLDDSGPGKFMEANETACSRLGYERAQLLQMSISDLLPPQDDSVIHRIIEQLRSSQSINLETELATREAVSFPVEINSHIFTLNGQTSVLFIVRDITERKTAERQLQANEARYRDLYEDNPSMYFTVSPDGIVLSVNRFGAQQLGYQNSELLNQPVETVFYPEDRAEVRKHLKRCLAGPEEVISWELRKVRKDGSLLWVRETARLLPREGREPVILIVCDDITDKKTAEEALIRSRANLQAMFNNTLQGFFLLDCQGRVQAFNKTAETWIHEVFAAQLKEGELLSNHLTSSETQAFQKAFKIVLSGQSLQKERHITNRNGKKFWFEVNYVPVLDNEKRVISVCLSAIDLNDRKNAEAQLVQSELRFRSIFEQSGIGIVLIDLEGRLMESNSTLQEILEYSPEELTGRSFSEICDPRGPRADIKTIYEALIGGRRFYQAECRFRRSDQKAVWGRFTATLVRDAEDSPLFAIGMVENISDRVFAVQALQDSEEKYRMLFNSGNDAIIVYRLDDLSRPTTIIEANNIACRLLGYTRQEILKLQPGDILVHDDPDFLKRSRQALKKNRHSLFEAELLSKNGERRPAEISAHLFEFRGRPTVISVARDISERRAAEKALRTSEERFRGLFEGIPLGLYQSDSHGNFIACNPTLVNMLGYGDAEELKEVNLENLYADAGDREKWKVIIEQLGIVRSFETRLLRKDGTEIWVRENARAVHGESGEILYYEGSIENITLRNKIEQNLKLSEERYRDIVENSADFIFTHSLKGGILSVNRAVVEQLGYKEPSELIGKNLRKFLVSRQKPLLKAYLRRIAESGNDSGFVEVVTAKGEIKILEYRNSLRTVGLDEPIVRGIARDVTAMIRAQNDLAEEKERLSVTLKSIAEGVITCDTEGRVILINGVAEQLTGWAPQEAAGRRVSEILTIQQEDTGLPCPSPVETVLSSGAASDLERPVELISRTGEKRLITANAAPMNDTRNHLIGAVLVFRDVSKLLTLEEELHKAQKLESLGILAGGIAHDFNNILTAIIGNVSLALLKLDGNEAAATRLLEAEKATQRAKDLTMQLLTFARGGAPFKQTSSIQEIIEESIRFVFHGSHLKCEFHFSENLWPVEVDRGQISQVINNLAINAMQAMPEGGTVTINAGNRLVTESENAVSNLPAAGHYVEISIKDEGVGISAQHLAQIFDPYFTTKKGGTGLGLATSYSIVKKHGGHIFVTSEEGAGSEFTVLLPAAPGKTIKVEEKRSTLQTGRGRILVMDDEETILDLLEKMLKMLGYEPIFSHDGREAVEIYRDFLSRKQPFDAVIMDLTVPGGMGGRQAVQELLKINPDIKAVVSSGYSNDPVMANFRQYGFVDRIMKPYDLQTVAEVLHRVLSDSRREQSGHLLN